MLVSVKQTAKSVIEGYIWGNTGLNKVKLVPLGLLQSLYCGGKKQIFQSYLVMESLGQRWGGYDLEGGESRFFSALWEMGTGGKNAPISCYSE